MSVLSRLRRWTGLLVCLALALALLAVTTIQAAGPCLVPSTAYPTIQAAVNDAACATVNVAAGTYSENISISRNVSIRGDSQATTIVDGGSSGTVFTINSGTVTLKGLTIRNGSADVGGGIYNHFSGTLTIQNSTVSGNSATIGGGIYNEIAKLTIRNSTISGNSATFGGGGIINDIGTLTIQNSTISGNSAARFGGGISNSLGALTVQNSTISGNSASNFGGGIHNDNGTVLLTRTKVVNNTPDDCFGCP